MAKRWKSKSEKSESGEKSAPEADKPKSNPFKKPSGEERRAKLYDRKKG